MFLHTLLRRDTEWRGVVLPAKSVIQTDDVRTAIALQEDGMAKPMDVVSINITSRCQDESQPENGFYPDIAIIGRVADGWGGGERSLKRITKLAIDRGWSVMLLPPDEFKNVTRKQYASPKLFIIQCCYSTPEYVASLRRKYPAAKIVQYVQFLGKMHTNWFDYDAVLFNSDTCMEKGIEAGCPPNKAIVQYPVLDASWARVSKGAHSGGYVLAPAFHTIKGKDIVIEVAKLMPDVDFIGLDREAKEQYVYDGVPNLQVHPWSMDMRGYYAKADIVLSPAQCFETYGRAVAEALGNGIPVVVPDTGNHPWFAEQAPGLVTLVHDQTVEGYVDAINDTMYHQVTHGERVSERAWERAWQIGIEGLTELCERFDIQPQQERLAVNAYVRGGLGDVVMAMPMLWEKSKHADIFLDPRTSDHIKSLLKACPYIRQGVAPKKSEAIDVVPFNSQENPQHWANELRQYSVARRYNEVLTSTQPVISLDGEMLDYMKTALPGTGRKRIGLGLTASAQAKSVCVQQIKKHAAALAEAGYDVYIFHNVRTVGDKAHVYDLGGKFDVYQTLHALALMDAVVAVDSGIAHMACAVQTPTVVLMGPVGTGKHIQFENTYPATKVVEVSKHMECQPCWFGSQYKCTGYGKCLVYKPVEILDMVQGVL